MLPSSTAVSAWRSQRRQHGRCTSGSVFLRNPIAISRTMQLANKSTYTVEAKFQMWCYEVLLGSGPYLRLPAQEAAALLEATLLHLQTYAALANLASQAGELFGKVWFHVMGIPRKCHVHPGLTLRLAWQVRPKHHVYHHLGLDMCNELVSCKTFHCFRDEAAMQYRKRALSEICSCVQPRYKRI